MRFLDEVWAGNTISQWLAAAAILLAIPVVVRLVDALLARQAEAGRGSRRAPIVVAIRRPLSTMIRFAGLWLIVHGAVTLPARLVPWAEGLIYFGLLLGLGWMTARLAEKGAEAYLARISADAPQQVNGLLRPLFIAVASGLAWLVVLALGLDNAGYEIGAVLAGLGIGGLAIAMASKDILVDLLGGVYIMVNRPFAVGDKILFKDKFAVVLDFGLRTTTLQDFDVNHKIVVPNGQFTSNAIVNISAHPGSMIVMNIRLSLTNEADRVAQALALVQEILKGNPEVRYIWSKLDHFDDYAFTLRIHYDILEFKQRIRVKSEINLGIARAFQAHGIKFAAMPVRALTGATEASDFVG